MTLSNNFTFDELTILIMQTFERTFKHVRGAAIDACVDQLLDGEADWNAAVMACVDAIREADMTAMREAMVKKMVEG